MILAIWIGLLHITLGRVLGMVNHARQDHGDHRIKAVMANFGWICVMWGILMVIWSVVQMPYMPDFTTLPEIVSGLNIAAVVGAVMLVAGVVFIARDSGLESLNSRQLSATCFLTHVSSLWDFLQWQSPWW